MRTGAAISANIRYVDRILPSAKDGKERRARHREYLQEGVVDHWLRRDWGWTYVETASLVVTAADQKVLLPADFMELGRDGGIYLAGTNMDGKLDEASPREIQATRRSGQTQSPPKRYAFWDSNSEGRRYIQLANGSDTTLHLYYRRKPPVLVDKPLDLTPTAGVVGLLNGTYNWAVSFITALGESELGFLSAQLVLALLKADLEDIPVYDAEDSDSNPVTGRRIYRNVDGDVDMLEEEVVADNETTTITTNIADGALGDPYPADVNGIYTGLEIFPQEHFHRVLRPYLRYRALEDRGDVRGELWKTRFEEGLGWAAKAEVQSKATQQQMAGFGLDHMY